MRLLRRLVPAMFVVFCSHGAAQTQNQIVAAGYQIPTPGAVAARGQVVTLFVYGLNVPDASATTIPLPTSLSGVTVRVSSPGIANYPKSLPIFSVVSYDFCAGRTVTSCPLTHITVQIPTEPTCVPSGLPNECSRPGTSILLNVEAGGTAGQSFLFSVEGSQPHIVTACDSIFGNKGGICYSLVTHADGTFVADAGYPAGLLARPGETITFYAVGLGPTNPLVPTGQAPPAATLATIPGSALPLAVSYRSFAASPDFFTPIQRWIYPSYAGLVAGYVGLYQVNVKLPEELAQVPPGSGSSRCPVSVRIAMGFDSFSADGTTHVDVCVQP